MSDNEAQTKFSLELPDFELEIIGDRKVVEDLYRQISHDLLPMLLLNRGEAPHPSEEKAGRPPSGRSERASFTWVYGCHKYYQKVYVLNDQELEDGLLGKHIIPGQVRRIYVDKDDGDLFTALGGRQNTLWAQFTEEGKDLFRSGRDPR